MAHGFFHMSNPFTFTAQAIHASSAIPAVGRSRQEDCSELKASLSYTAYIRTNKSTKVELWEEEEAQRVSLNISR